MPYIRGEKLFEKQGTPDAMKIDLIIKVDSDNQKEAELGKNSAFNFFPPFCFMYQYKANNNHKANKGILFT